MNKILLAMTALGAIAAAAPAAAQFPVRTQAAGSVQGHLAELDARLEAGIRNGSIDRNELRQLRMELRDIQRLEYRYASGGLSRAERNDLRLRVRTLRQRIAQAEASYNRDGRWQDRDDRWEDRDDRDGRRWDRNGNRRDGRDCPPGLEKRNNGCVPPGQVGRDRDWNDRDDDRRGGFIDRNRDGYDDRDTNRDGRIDSRDRHYDDRDDDRFGGFIDRNRDGFDDRDTNRDGRIDSRDRDYDDRYEDRDGGFIDRNRDGWDDRDTNRDGRIDSRDRDYDDRDDRRGGGGIIGNVLDRVLGGSGGGLRVGQRVTGNLGPVPYEYRNQYRDGNGVYYRSDGRAIYQIDARTNVVLQIYALRR